MKKRAVSGLLALTMAALPLTGCGNEEESVKETEVTVEAESVEEAEVAVEAESLEEAEAAAEEAYNDGTRTITDLDGREVTIPENVENIIAIPWPWTSIVFAVDGTDEHIAGMAATAKKSYENCMFKILAPNLADTASDYIEDAAAGGTFGNVNFEEMANVDPDLVLVYKAQSADIPSYEAIDVPVAIVNYGSLDQVQEGIRLLGEILHKEDRAEQIISYHENTAEDVEKRVADVEDDDKPSVLYLYNSSLMTQPIGFTATMIEQAGGINAAKDVAIPEDGTNNFATIDMETIYAMDPDVIIMSNFDTFTPEDIYNNTLADADWSQLKAVKNQQVYKVPMGIYRWSQPNVEAHLYLEWLGKILQPEAFSDVDLQADTEDFYKTMFDHDLSDEELNMIYKSELNSSLTLWSE